ncbi:MAG: hypothetical protein KDA99_24145, partial [Planctomycetales bacterium]|nr:hypothetical protein [Planctomycetales bacterium]
SPGKHTMATYHSSFWKDPLPPFDILIHGALRHSAGRPSLRVTNDADAAVAYFEIRDSDTRPIVIDFVAKDSTDDGARSTALKHVVLNGIELDGTNPLSRARVPQPLDGDEHVAASPTLSWRPAAAAVAHDLYFGTSQSVVAAATHRSPEYLGRVSDARHTCAAKEPNAEYFWRVDEVHGEHAEEVITGDVWRFRVRHLAFPTAEGYGRFARGGRGGRVLEVTNLNDSGPGSLREAVEAEGARTVVFRVSGLITLESKLIVRHPYLTIAGQTAPGKGICLRKFNLGVIGAHDVVIRYLRVRPGDLSGVTLDGMGLASGDHCIIDHCSISWTLDEAFSSRAAKNITFQRSLISEALNVAGHKNYKPGTQHGYAASIGGDIGSFHHNLLAHCAGRNWSLAGGLDKAGVHTGRLDIRNNVVYNWSHRTTDGGAMQVNFVNNYYKPGPSSKVFHVLKPERNLGFGPQDYFVEGNVMEGRYDASLRWEGVIKPRDEELDDFIHETPFFPSYVVTEPANVAFESVLADVGCNLPVLDDHDARVMEEVRNGTCTFRGSVTQLPGLPDSQQDVGGWEEYPELSRTEEWDSDHDGLPDAWEMANGTNPSSPANDFGDANADPDGDGYTLLEDYLNSITAKPG